MDLAACLVSVWMGFSTGGRWHVFLFAFSWAAEEQASALLEFDVMLLVPLQMYPWKTGKGKYLILHKWSIWTEFVDKHENQLRFVRSKVG